MHIKSKDGHPNGLIQPKNTTGWQLLADFEYTPPSAKRTGRPEVYRLTETRPINLNEIYYLDHPKFGVIVKINTP